MPPTAHNAIPIRLERGESIDVVIMAGPALADLIREGKVRADSRVDPPRSVGSITGANSSNLDRGERPSGIAVLDLVGGWSRYGISARIDKTTDCGEFIPLERK